MIRPEQQVPAPHGAPTIRDGETRTMSDCKWYEIDSFASPYEVNSFQTYLARQVAEGHAEELPPASCEAGANAKCFRWKGTGDIWRLIPPHGSMRGCWQPV